MKKWFILVFYIVIFIFGFNHREMIVSWINETNTDAGYFLTMLLLSAFIATIPIFPFTLFGGIIGVKYGIFFGLLINWFGMLSAAIIYYIFSRYLLADYFRKRINRFNKIEKLQSFMNNHLFLAILLLRLLPIIPPFVIHIYSGVSQIPYYTYLFATALGLIPPMFMLAYGGLHILTNFSQVLVLLTLYALTVLMIFFFYKVRTKKQGTVY